MSGDLTIDLVGLLPMKRQLDRLSGRRTRVLLDRVGFAVENQTRRRFGEKRAPDGKRWADWSTGYEESGRGRSILERSGALRDSISYEVRGDDLIVGSNLAYARRHQLGDKGVTVTRGRDAGGRFTSGKKGKGIPARPFLGLSRANERQIIRLVTRWIEREVAR